MPIISELLRAIYMVQKADEVLAHTYNHIYGLSITALRFVSYSNVIIRAIVLWFPYQVRLISVQCLICFVQVFHCVWSLGQTRHGLFLFYKEHCGGTGNL